MSGFIQYIVIGCIAFTCSSIFYLLFSVLSIFPPFNEQMTISMMIITFSIIVLMYIKNLLPIYNPTAMRIIEIVNVLLVLLVAGAVFSIFPFTPYYVLTVTLSGLLTYIVVIIVLFVGNIFNAQEINAAIANKKMDD